MPRPATLPRLLRRPLAIVAPASVLPYLGLLGLLAIGHRDAAAMIRPPGASLAILAALGGLVPLAVVVFAFVRIIRDTSRFRPALLVELYAGFVLVFASSYALVQCAFDEPAFANAPVLWTGETSLAFTDHLERLHSVFGTMLYLSVVTMTTVGYGDITPLSASARTLTAIQSLCGVSFVSISVGHYFAVCTRRC